MRGGGRVVRGVRRWVGDEGEEGSSGEVGVGKEKGEGETGVGWEEK